MRQQYELTPEQECDLARGRDAPEVALDGSKALGCCDCERTFADSREQDEHARKTGHDIGYSLVVVDEDEEVK